ncbi:MAG: GUN4 domain-containing protein, partial [Microcystis aeruginosa]
IEYETVRIGNAEQLSGSSKVYVFGWAVPSKTSRDRRARFFGPGNVLGTDRKAAGGYQIAHKLELLPGMSGGPLLHENGCLVGINGGGGKRDPNIQVIEFLSVPINLYASWQNIQVVDDCRATPLPDNNLFKTLRNLLEQGNWQQAEAETKKLMLRGTDQTYFNGNIINNLSCSNLKIINRLWVQYSSGRFGFSVQGEIWKGVTNYKQFEERVGWRRGYEGPLTDPPNYSLEAKRGHLPSYKLLAASDFGTFLNRLEKCDALSFTDSGIIENIISSESEP